MRRAMAPSSTRIPLILGALLFLGPNVALATAPLIDFDRMGSVGLTGAFSGLGLSDNSTVSTTFDDSKSTLLARSSDGALTALGSTNTGGTIVAGCALDDVYYFAGNFTSINGTSASYVASYTSSSDSFAALGSDGPNGEVHALYCDATNGTVWAGGKFSSPAESVAVWEPKSSKWSSPPFGGLSGADAEVFAIATNSSGTSLLFVGSFITAFGNTTINSTNNPNVPYSAGASSFSSSLVPIGLQNAQIVAAPSSDESGYDDIEDILCPAGADGSGNTWWAEDGQEALITVQAYTLLNARGVRLGNTFLDGRGTTGFTVTTIPDNTVREVTYVDLTTGENATCTNPCPLSTDSSILYQDFLFSENLEITGFQLALTEWQGAGSGLHILQLLSSGAYASAVASNNTESCYAPTTSNVTYTGTWTEKEANTDIPATTEAVLVSTVAVGTSASAGPSFTWEPYVSASGEYDVYMYVPGCTEFQDCDYRTSVSVTVFPGAGMDPWVTTVSQENTDDATTLVYSGPIVPSTPDFVTTITMTLAADPTGSGENGEYEIVAGSIELVLTSANVTSSSTNSTSTTGADAFGFFEWSLSSASTVDATSALSNSTETYLDKIGVSLYQAIGSSSLASSAPVIAAVVQHSSGAVFLGGNFTLTSGSASGATNIVVFKDGALSALADDGLNGDVTSLAIDDNTLYVGGAFDDTTSASTSGALAGVAAYNIEDSKWSALSTGVNGAVTSLAFSNGQLLMTGNFTAINGNSSSGDNAAGFAVWEPANSTFVNSGGYLIGSMTFVGNGTSTSGSDAQFVAGNVEASLAYGASGFVTVQNGADGAPEIAPLGVQLYANTTSTTTTSSLTRRRFSHAARATHSWLPRFNVLSMFKRDTTTTALAPLPTTTSVPAPAVLAGAFWTNSSSSKELIILGGNFSFTSGGSSYSNLAIYDNSTDTVTPLQGSQINGTVRSLLVQDDLLFIGGEFTLEGTDVNGFAVYDLASQQWDVTGVQTLQASSGSTVVVRSVTASPSQENVVIVAGSFAQAGSTACRAICSFDSSTVQWSALGNGIQGDVASVAYAGTDDALVIAAGSIALADSTLANVAMFVISNSTWMAVGDGSDLPGPVTAVTVNDGNSSSIFAAGRSSDNTTAFLYFWDGESWTSVGSTLDSSTDVYQLAMVPLQNTHSDNAIIQSDRVLMVSGSLSSSSFGNVSSALFDGSSFIPYIVTASSSGAAGAIYGIIYSVANFSFSQAHYLAVGVVILISIAISAGIVFLLALIGILWTLFSRRDDKLSRFDAAETEDDDDSTHRPSSLLAHINAATRTTIMGDTPFGPHAEKEGAEVAAAGAGAAAAEHDPFGPDASNYVRAGTPSDAIAGTMGEEMNRPAHARYSFDGEGEGELALSSGQEIEVLDDRDNAWWYARDVRTGREGVVPAAYVY